MNLKRPTRSEIFLHPLRGGLTPPAFYVHPDQFELVTPPPPPWGQVLDRRQHRAFTE